MSWADGGKVLQRCLVCQSLFLTGGTRRILCCGERVRTRVTDPCGHPGPCRLLHKRESDTPAVAAAAEIPDFLRGLMRST
jgi:hypothetical protein